MLRGGGTFLARLFLHHIRMATTIAAKKRKTETPTIMAMVLLLNFAPSGLGSLSSSPLEFRDVLVAAAPDLEAVAEDDIEVFVASVVSPAAVSPASVEEDG